MLEFLFKLILPVILVVLFRGGKPFAGRHRSRFWGDIALVVVGWIFLFWIFR